MAEGKVNRNNHPILVKARKESYWAGKSDGYKEGYQKGYGARCEEIHRYYRIVITALETSVKLANEEIRILREEIHNG